MGLIYTFTSADKNKRTVTIRTRPDGLLCGLLDFFPKFAIENVLTDTECRLLRRAVIGTYGWGSSNAIELSKAVGSLSGSTKIEEPLLNHDEFAL